VHFTSSLTTFKTEAAGLYEVLVGTSLHSEISQ